MAIQVIHSRSRTSFNVSFIARLKLTLPDGEPNGTTVFRLVEPFPPSALGGEEQLFWADCCRGPLSVPSLRKSVKRIRSWGDEKKKKQ